MTLPEGDIEALAWALLDEAVDENHEYTNEIDIDQLRVILDKHKGLVENFTTRYVYTYLSMKKSSYLIEK